MSKTFWVYCRGCNRAIEVIEETKSEYFEYTKIGISRHPKIDCDEIYQ